MRNLFILLTFSLTLLLPSANAKTISTNNKANVIVDASKFNQRICMYADKSYSIGAMISVGKYIIQCQNLNDFETNSTVGWKQIEPKHDFSNQ